MPPPRWKPSPSIERDDVVVAEQVDHVDLSESLSQPPDEFGADAPVLPVSDHLEVWDVCAGDAIAEGRDETDDPPWILSMASTI